MPFVVYNALYINTINLYLRYYKIIFTNSHFYLPVALRNTMH
jgi:hypothetical protein